MRKYIPHILIITFVFIPIPITSATGGSITLRSSYKTLFVSEVWSMPNVSIREKYAWGFIGHSTINHDYNLKIIEGDTVVVDNATGLMWHQSGSDDEISWEKAKEWIKKLNKGGYAGYQDWRLPTVDEAASLLDSRVASRDMMTDFLLLKSSFSPGNLLQEELEIDEKNRDLCIDPVFSKKQIYIWTGDEAEYEDDSEVAWDVNLINGHVRIPQLVKLRYHCNHVRPVRSVR